MTETAPVSADDSIKRLVAKSFAQAGAWALLCLILISGVGYQVNWLVTRYVDATTKMMDALVESVASSQKLISDNRQLIEQSIRTTERVVALMEDAAKTMHAVPSERKEQTEILKEIRQLIRQEAIELRARENAP